ncbi:MAG: RNA polymerase sigma factor [Gaiellaceae bacterium]
MEGRPLEERELVLRAQRGDSRAFDEIVLAYQEIAFRVAYLITGGAAEAEDAAQDGFLKAWRALGRFRRDAPLRPWLLSIVANEARNRRRSAGRRARLALRPELQGSSGDTALSPEVELVARDERHRLLAALDGLPDDARAVLVCRYLLDLSEQETAAALDLRKGTVKSRTARALDRLRETYD